MSGFIYLHRDAFNHHLLSKPEIFHAWFFIVSKACWKPQKFNIKGKTVELERGQYCTTIRALADELSWKKDKLNRLLTRLKNETMIETETKLGKTVITICNYNKYQNNDEAEISVNETENETVMRQKCDKSATQKNKDNKDNKDNKNIQAFEAWNLLAKDIGVKSIISLSDSRKQKLSKRIAEQSIDGFMQAMDAARRSDWLRIEKPAFFTFDWVISNETNILKLLEGNFEKRTSNGQRNNNSKRAFGYAERQNINRNDNIKLVKPSEGRSFQPTAMLEQC